MVSLVAEKSPDRIDARQQSTISGFELVPATIRESGVKAVESYLCFFSTLGSKHTGYVYRAATKHFFRWMDQQGLPLESLRAGHVETFFAKTPWKSSTVSFYFHSLKKLFAHLESDRAVNRSPFAGLPTPKPLARRVRKGALEELKQFLLDLDGYDEKNKHYGPGMVAMYPIIIGGMDTKEIAEVTDLPLEEVEIYAGRLRENGIWTPDNRIAVDFDDPEKDADLAVVNMVLIIGCAAGVFARYSAEAADTDNATKGSGDSK
jgi:hypothetical protein